MGTMKVILKKDVPSLGEEGDIKVVRKGYARNYLFPQGLVAEFSKQNINILESKKDYYEKKKLQKRENSEQLKAKLETEKIKVLVPAGEKGRLYGTVTTQNLADELAKLDYKIEKKNIDLKEHVKFVGIYKFRVHLYQDIYATIELEVEAEKQPEKEARQKPKKKRGRRSDEDAVEETTGDEAVAETPVEEAATEEAQVENPAEEEQPEAGE